VVELYAFCLASARLAWPDLVEGFAREPISLSRARKGVTRVPKRGIAVLEPDGRGCGARRDRRPDPLAGGRCAQRARCTSRRDFIGEQLPDASAAKYVASNRGGAAARGVVAHHSRRRIALPRPIVAGEHPEIAGLGSSPPGVEHRCRGFVDEELG
jgi:hypothetical protein